MSVCPTCNMKLHSGEDCPRCAATETQANRTGTSPELDYLRNFYRSYSADPVCPECGARYESEERGPFDAGHWMANHWRQEHLSMYEQHKARVEGREAAA